MFWKTDYVHRSDLAICEKCGALLFKSNAIRKISSKGYGIIHDIYFCTDHAPLWDKRNLRTDFEFINKPLKRWWYQRMAMCDENGKVIEEGKK